MSSGSWGSLATRYESVGRGRNWRRPRVGRTHPPTGRVAHCGSFGTVPLSPALPPCLGVTLNVGKRRASVSVGRRGAKANFGRRGTAPTLSLLGTGLSYVWRRRRG